MKNIFLIFLLVSLGVSADVKIGGISYFDYTNADKASAFNFNRQYTSFSGAASDDVKFNVVFDVGRTNKSDEGDKHLVAFLKKAQIDYMVSRCKVSLGLIGMNAHGVQEENWGYRFIEKSAIDKNGFTSTADLGVGFSKVTSDLIVNLQIVNGEGYKNPQPQMDEYHKISINIKNHQNAGIVYSTEDSDDGITTMMSLFGIINHNSYRISGEHDKLTVGGDDETISSMSASYYLTNDMDVFVRYDMYDPNTDDENDGENYLIAGVVFNCGSGLSISPNLRMTSYENDAESITEYKINCQFKF